MSKPQGSISQKAEIRNNETRGIKGKAEQLSQHTKSSSVAQSKE
jgi:hypothetical protein